MILERCAAPLRAERTIAGPGGLNGPALGYLKTRCGGSVEREPPLYDVGD